MSVFTTENQTSAYAKDPSYYTGSGFVLGMLGYKKNGQKSLFGKIKDVALPVIGGIAGTAIGGPAGAKIGATIGQGLNAASTAAAEGIVGGDEDSLANVSEDMSGTLARGNLGISLGNVAGGVQAGVQAGDGIGKILKDVVPTFQKDLPAIGSGVAGAIGANSTPTYPIGKRVRYFATGGEVTPNIVPLSIRNVLSINQGGRDRRRIERLTDGLAERVDSEVDANKVALEKQQSQAYVDAFNKGRLVQAPATRTEVSRPGSVLANQSGADYVRDYMTAKGYGFQAANVQTPQLLRPTDFKRNTGWDPNDASGVYMGDRDQSYTVDFYDKGHTRSIAAHETTHDAQDALKDTPEMQQSLATLASRVQNRDSAYQSDPEELQARKLQMDAAINQDPNKPFNRNKWRLNNFVNTITFGLANKAENDAFRDMKHVMGRKNVFKSMNDTFEKGGEVKPFTYTYAGMTFRIKQPKDYKVYDSNDHTEDLVITDKEGNHYGQMRIGERVQDQHSNLAMKAIMRSSASEEKKKEALGELLHEELISHDANEEGESMYQGGGDVKPRQSGATSVTTVNEARARAARMGNNSADKQAKLAKLRADLVTARQGMASTTNPAAKVRYQNNINSMQSELDSYVPAPVAKPAPAPAPTPAPVAPVKSSTAPAVTSNRPAVPSSVRRGASAGSRPKVAAPPVTPQSRIAKMTHGQLVSTLGKVTTPEIITSNVPSAPESAITPAKPNMDVVASAIGVNTPAPATTYDPHPKVEESAPKSSVDNVGNLMDISRVVTGAVMASKKTPTYSLPAMYTQYQQELAQKKDQGYSSQEWNTINGNVADTYAAGQTALTNNLGGGATPGVVLAGLTRLNQQRSQQQQAAIVGDVAQKARNFANYGQSVLRDTEMDRQTYDASVEQSNGNRLAGVQLAQSGLQNIEQRKLFENSYGPGSMYGKIMQKQLDLDTEATNLVRSMRKKAMAAGTAAVE